MAASAAEFSGPVPPMTAAVAMMMHIETRSDTMAPLTASTRSYLYSSGPMPRSTMAPAVYSWMYGVMVVPMSATATRRKALEPTMWGINVLAATSFQLGCPRNMANG